MKHGQGETYPTATLLSAIDEARGYNIPGEKRREKDRRFPSGTPRPLYR